MIKDSTIAVELNEEQISILMNRLLGAPYNTDDLYLLLNDKRKELQKQKEIEELERLIK